MILTCNYEELQALRRGGELLARGDVARSWSDEGVVLEGGLARARGRFEWLQPQLTGDLSVATLGEQVDLEAAIRDLVQVLRAEMHSEVLAAHPADEGAVAAYFDYAHALSVLGRLREIGDSMRAVAELVGGVELAFPD